MHHKCNKCLYFLDCGATTSLISTTKHSDIGPNHALPVKPVTQTLQAVNSEYLYVKGSVYLIVRIGDKHFDLKLMVCDLDLDDT